MTKAVPKGMPGQGRKSGRFVEHIQGVPEKVVHKEFCNVLSIVHPMIVGLFWCLFLMKSEICVIALSTEPFLTDLRVARYLVFSFAFLSNQFVYLKK